MLPFVDFKNAADSIPYQYRHPFFLYSLVKWLELKNIVEVGSHLGMTAVWLARAIQENGEGHLWCIDNFCWVRENQEQLWNHHIDKCRVRDVVTLIKGRSQEVQWPNFVDFAFIDGNHTYPVCKHDTQMAMNLGAKCIAIHDTVSWEGTRRYADEIRHELYGKWDIFEVNFDEGLTVLLRREPKGECRGTDIGEQWDKPT